MRVRLAFLDRRRRGQIDFDKQPGPLVRCPHQAVMQLNGAFGDRQPQPYATAGTAPVRSPPGRTGRRYS